MPPRRITVLFVDDDAGFLDVVQNLMQTCSEGLWDVLTAQDATRALAVLRDQRIDLMVIDVHMPVMDGVQFLGLLHRKYPNMRKAVLTGLATEAYRAACLSNGAELFLEKPVNREGWESLFTALDELVRFQPEEGFQGVLRRVGLQDVLQMECLARSSSVLDISTAETHGSIFVKDGQIIHAQMGQLAGEEAFNHLLSLSGGQFNLKPFTEPPTRTISGSWEFLLMEAARKRDEAQDPLLGLAAGGAGDAATAPAEDEKFVHPTPVPGAAETPAPGAPEREAAQVGPARGAGAAPAPRPAETRRPNIDEVLICSTQGDVLYEWQCADANARIRFLQFLSQKSWQLRQGLPLGHFQRLEMEGLNNRVVTHIDPDRALFVRVTRAPGETVG
ncbi:MAG TPA: response regulator [Haliangiales bacterium]|nr:response regulator [Haliangiales bacterium]